MRFSERLSGKAKKTIAAAVLLFLAGIGIAAYTLNDYVENSPGACMRCHVHDGANKAWARSAHRAVHCRECHQFSKKELIIHNFGRKTPSSRDGDALAPWQRCKTCHWEKNDKYSTAPAVKLSGFHARHVSVERIECSRCHGSVIHQFLPEERFCVKCHRGWVVHGTAMEQLACINCHSDRTADLMPDREKCLYCHGDESARRRLIGEGGLDVKYFRPSPEVIRKAIKIKTTANAPMRFKCYECHKPHTRVRADYGDCLSCHGDQLSVGKHELHIKRAGMKCIDCHKPHVWKMSQAQAGKVCAACHKYRDPEKFMQ